MYTSSIKNLVTYRVEDKQMMRTCMTLTNIAHAPLTLGGYGCTCPNQHTSCIIFISSLFYHSNIVTSTIWDIISIMIYSRIKMTYHPCNIGCSRIKMIYHPRWDGGLDMQVHWTIEPYNVTISTIVTIISQM